MHIHQEVQRSSGPDVIIHCPACFLRNVSAVTFDQETRDKLYGLIPVNRIQTSWVVCSGCRAPLRSRVSVVELDGLEADQIADLLYVDAGFVPKALAVIAIVCAIFPVVGTVFAAGALFANRKFPGWSRTLSWVALGVSFVPLALVGFLALMAGLGVLK